MPRRTLLLVMLLAAGHAFAGEFTPAMVWTGTSPSGACKGNRVALEVSTGKLWCCTGTNWAACGEVQSAVALGANGANCPVGQAALGVDAAGAAEGCWSVAPATSGTSLLIGNGSGGTASYAGSGSCAAGSFFTAVDGSGAKTCATPPAQDWSVITGKPSTFTPVAHASTHASGSSDPVTLAQSQVTNLTTDLAGKLSTTGTAADSSKLGGVAAASYWTATSLPFNYASSTARLAGTFARANVSAGTAASPADEEGFIYGYASGSTVGSPAGVYFRNSFQNDAAAWLAFKTTDAAGTTAVRATVKGTLGTGAVYTNGGEFTSTNPSDRRLKTDIRPFDYGLREVLRLRSSWFRWKDDRGDQGVVPGWIAQDVQAVMPAAVKRLNDGSDHLGIEKDAITAALVNAVQQQQREIELHRWALALALVGCFLSLVRRGAP